MFDKVIINNLDFNHISPQLGMKQGYQHSPLLFVLAIEPLAQHIQHNPEEVVMGNGPSVDLYPGPT